MKSIEIKNTSDLLEFIKCDEVSVEIASLVIRKALKVNILLKNTKAHLIDDTEHYINKYCRKSSKDRPLFLQKNIPDIGNRK